MLVLRTKIGEQIMMDEQIEVAVLEVHGNRFKLGFVVPRNIAINAGKSAATKKLSINHDRESE